MDLALSVSRVSSHNSQLDDKFEFRSTRKTNYCGTMKSNSFLGNAKYVGILRKKVTHGDIWIKPLVLSDSKNQPKKKTDLESKKKRAIKRLIEFQIKQDCIRNSDVKEKENLLNPNEHKLDSVPSIRRSSFQSMNLSNLATHRRRVDSWNAEV